MAKQSQETTNKETQLRIQNVVDEIKSLSGEVRGLYVIFVTKEEFLLVRNIVFGFIGLLLLAFAQQIINGHLK